MHFDHVFERYDYLGSTILEFLDIRNKDFMTFSIFDIKGEQNDNRSY